MVRAGAATVSDGFDEVSMKGVGSKASSIRQYHNALLSVHVFKDIGLPPEITFPQSLER